MEATCKRYFVYMTEEGDILRNTKADTPEKCFVNFISMYQHDKLYDEWVEGEKQDIDLKIRFLGVCNGRIIPFTGENDSTIDVNYIRQLKGLSHEQFRESHR